MKRNIVIFAVSAVLLVVLFCIDVCSGSLWLWPFGELSPMESNILHAIRLPKALTAVLAGAALSVSGLIMQTLFRNPLAGPYTLGVSSGASLGVALLTMLGGLFSSLAFPLFAVGLPIAACVGATLVLMLVLAVSRRVTSNVSLLIVGMMLLTLKPLNGLLLGEDYARGLGIDVPRTRLFIVLATGLLAGGVTAFCGPIAFIGVAVPHIARGIFRTSNHRVTIPASALLGASLLLVCDVLCSLFTYPLPVSTVSALFGAPVIIWIILKNK